MRPIILFLLLVSSRSLSADIQVTDQIKQANETYGALASKLVESSTSNRLAKESSLSHLETYLKSDEYASRQSELSQMLGSSLGIEMEKPSDQGRQPKTVLPKGHAALLYLSSSMPLHVIHRYALDLDKIGGVILLRGPIGGISKMLPTSKFITQISKRDMSCVDTPDHTCDRLNISVRIDPKRFSENGITAVPAITFETNYSGDFYCHTGQPHRSTHVVYGDSQLKGLLSALYDLSNQPALELPIDILRGAEQPGANKS